MRINLIKFGSRLSSREAGREAFLAIQPTLEQVSETEQVEVDFTGVEAFSTSWGDEMLGGLSKRFGNRLALKVTDNPSVKISLELLEKINGRKFKQA